MYIRCIHLMYIGYVYLIFDVGNKVWVFLGCVSAAFWVPTRPTTFRIHPQVDLDVGNPMFRVLELENRRFY